MTPKEKKIADFAKMVLESPAKDDVIERITQDAFKRFITGNHDQRVAISEIMSSTGLFFTELQRIVAENTTPNPEDDKVEDITR